MNPFVSAILALSFMLVEGECGVVSGTARPLRHRIASPRPAFATFSRYAPFSMAWMWQTTAEHPYCCPISPNCLEIIGIELNRVSEVTI